MVVEMSPWSSSLGLINVREPFFPPENRPFKATVHREAHTDVKQDPQIRQICHKSDPNLRVLVFTLTAPTLWHRSGTIVPWTWQFAVIRRFSSFGRSRKNGARLATVENVPFLRWYRTYSISDILTVWWAYLHVRDIDPSPVGYGSFCQFRILQLAVNWTSSCSKIRRIWQLWFYI
jgi:hypothetical protein